MVEKCSWCGTELKPGAKFCSKCGKPTEEKKEETSQKTKVDPFKKEEKTKKSGPFKSESNSITVSKRSIGIVIAIIVVILAITLASMGTTSSDSGNVTISIFSTESYATSEIDYSSSDLNETGNLDYNYEVNGELYPENENVNLENYTLLITFLDGDRTVASEEGFITYYDNVNSFSCYYYPTTPYNITDVRVELINLRGETVGTAESVFTMGDMTTARF